MKRPLRRRFTRVLVFPYLSPAAEIGVNASVYAGESERLAAYERQQSKQLTDEEVEAQEELIDKKVDAISHKQVFTRLAVLVDGGYADNTGLAPTRQALDYIYERRDRERKNPTRVSSFLDMGTTVLHIRNDPGSLCLLPDPARYSSQVRAFDTLTGRVHRCDFEIDALDASLRARPMQWLTTPLQTLLAVRVEQSSRTRRELQTAIYDKSRAMPPAEGARMHDGWMEYSVETELANAYGVPPSDETERLLASGSLFGALETDALAIAGDVELRLREAAHVERGRNQISQRSLDEYIHRLDRWHRSIEKVIDESDKCVSQRPATLPPLGWKLNAVNVALLNCLQSRAARRNLLLAMPPSLAHEPVGSPTQSDDDSTRLDDSVNE
ncbi:hypothetical protein [Caballeronia sp. GAFFF1]|uniref:hypothetical protein n=1 Tax=Caballeronia sp. GAFFF1 TaxID=2921779 RepID=UPI002027BC3F|nr:hypothetical protein [Caballeronia sp. GAFFF1]